MIGSDTADISGSRMLGPKGGLSRRASERVNWMQHHPWGIYYGAE